MGVLALAQTLPQLLASRGQFVDERCAKAFARRVPLHHDAVGLLQTLCQRVSYNIARFSDRAGVQRGFFPRGAGRAQKSPGGNLRPRGRG